MARRRAVAPEVVDEWTTRLHDARRELEEINELRDQRIAQYRATICNAFAAGLSVTPIKAATGYTTSRLYQIKSGRRT